MKCVLKILGVSILATFLPDKAKGQAEKRSTEARDFNANRVGQQKEIEIGPGVSMTFCWCPSGDFLMGRAPQNKESGSEKSQVKVTLSKGFWIAKTEVTQAQWQVVMGNNPSVYYKGESLPVQDVS